MAGPLNPELPGESVLGQKVFAVWTGVGNNQFDAGAMVAVPPPTTEPLGMKPPPTGCCKGGANAFDVLVAAVNNQQFTVDDVMRLAAAMGPPK